MRSRVPLFVFLFVLLTGAWLLLRGEDPELQTDPEPQRTESPNDEARLQASVRPDDEAATREPAPRTDDVVPLPDATVPLTGIVVDTERAAIVGARVVLEELRGDTLSIPAGDERWTVELSMETETGDDGGFSFRAPFARVLQVRVEAKGFGGETTRPAYAGHHYEIVLRSGAAVEGRVTEAGTGLPVSGVKLRGWRKADRVPLLAGWSDEGGGFHFEGLPVGVLVLDITPPEHEGPAWLEIPLRAGETARADVALEVGNTVVGTVTDARSGQPIAGAEVGAGWTFEKSVRTDAAGNYRMRGAPGPGVASMQARADGYAKGVVPVGGETRERIDFALQPAGALRGRVVDRAGAPLSRVYVAASGSLPGEGPVRFSDRQSSWTDEQGAFRLTGLVPGVHYALFVRKRGFTGKSFDLPAPIDAEGEMEVGDLPLDVPGALAGRIVDRHGEAVSGTYLTLTGDNADRDLLLGNSGSAARYAPGGIREARSDSDGGFAFPDLPEGTYSLLARVRNGPRKQVNDLAVRAGETTPVELVVDLGLRIAGRVVSSDGGPLPVGHVAVQIQKEGNAVHFLPVDHEGRFSVIGLESGGYDLSVEVSRWANDEVPPWLGSDKQGVAAGTEDVELVLHAAAMVEGRVIDTEGKPRPGLSVFALLTGTDEEVARSLTNAEGRFRLRSLPGQVLDLRYGVAPVSEYPNSALPPTAETARVYRGVRAGAKGLVLEY